MQTDDANRSTPWRVLLVGCGRIAGGFDGPDSPHTLTHAKAFTQHPDFELVACVDPDGSARQSFARKWGIRDAYQAIEPALEARTYDVVSICTPSILHADHVAAALLAQPKLIFCEKPFSTDPVKGAELADRAKHLGVPICVNYSRHWDPGMVALRAALMQNDWGTIRSVVISYNKGIINNGSHAIDLLRSLFGTVQIGGSFATVSDYSETDPTVAATLTVDGNTPVVLQLGHAGDFSLFEVQIVTEEGVITIEQGGQRIRERRRLPSPVFDGYRALDDGTFKDGGLLEALPRALDNCALFLQGTERLACDAAMAVETERFCHILAAMAQTD